MSEPRPMTIGDLCKRGIVELQTGPFGSQLHAHDYVDRGVPVVPTEAIADRRINHDKLPQISKSKADALSRHYLRKGDILFARRGVQATGQSALVRDKEEGFICGTGAIRLRLKLGNDQLRANFLSHVLMDRASREWIRHNAIGATMPNLNEGIIKRFSFLAPSTAAQDRIANLLDDLDDKIELNRRMNETLEAMARAIFKDWFVDFGPTRAKMEGREAYLAPEIWSLFPDRLDDEGKPEGWQAGELSNLLEIAPSEIIGKNQSAPYLDMASLPTRGACSDLPISRVYSSGSKFRNGDTLLARITPCLENGKTAFVQNLPSDVVGWGSTEFIVMRTKAPVPKPVSYLIARDPAFRRHAIQSMTGTSGRQRANADAIKTYPATYPLQAPLWNSLGGLLSPIFAKIASASEESLTLAATRDLLLPKLMSGEIRIKEAEKLVGEVD